MFHSVEEEQRIFHINGPIKISCEKQNCARSHPRFQKFFRGWHHGLFYVQWPISVGVPSMLQIPESATVAVGVSSPICVVFIWPVDGAAAPAGSVLPRSRKPAHTANNIVDDRSKQSGSTAPGRRTISRQLRCRRQMAVRFQQPNCTFTLRWRHHRMRWQNAEYRLNGFVCTQFT